MIALVLGTKAELIKCMPVMKELEKGGVNYYFIHTGQHTIIDLVKDFEVKEPDIVLYEPPKLSSRFMVKTHKAIFWALPLIFKIRSTIRKLNPEYVLYHGDTLTTSAAAVATSKLLNPFKKWKNVHLEAGLRSFNIFEPFPEEISRRVADKFSDILFAPSDLSVENLKKEKVTGEIIKVGNTIVDSVLISLELAKKRKLKKLKGKYVVVNIHRHENIKSKERMRKIVEIVKNVSLPIYWPIHDNTKKQLKKFKLWEELQKQNIHFMPLISYIEFIWLMKNATYLITDGGSIQEESLTLKIPCILLRERTERQEGLRTGINFLTKLDVEYTKKIIERLESTQFKVPGFKNPYGDGKAAKRIVEYLMKK